MEHYILLKAVIDADLAPIVVCDLQHTVVYMNPASIERYGRNLTGKNIKGCHNEDSAKRIERVVNWFKQNTTNNIIYTGRNDAENKDVYMVALRSDTGELLGYYEKHEFRNAETQRPYNF